MKNNFEHIFKKNFDTSEPTIGHFERFEKILTASKAIEKPIKHIPKTWSWLIVAASITLIFGFWLGQNSTNDRLELADVSPKMEETQNYFTSLIRVEIEKINTQKSEENRQLIKDAFQRINTLETQYSKLTLALKESNEDQRVIFAMISNFQQRIEVLQNLLVQLSTLKQYKTTEYETTI